MNTVFLSGSRKISRLNNEVRNRLHNIIENNYFVLVGDANGADKALQKYLADMNYPYVTVYCSGKICRNNIGKWKSNNITVSSNLKGREFYTQKDIKMAEEADYGFILWDGQSIGSVNNVFELLKRNKKALVYVSPEKKFYSITNVREVKELLEKCNEHTLDMFNKKIKLHKLLSEIGEAKQETLSF